MNDQNTPCPVPSIGRTFRKAFVDIYDHLGLVTAASFIWLVASLIPMTLGVELQRRAASPFSAVIGFFASFVVAAALGIGLFYMAHNIVYRQDPSIADLFAGFKPLFVPAMSLIIVDAVITGILTADLAFFFGLFEFSRELAQNPLFFAVGVFFIWVMLFWLMTAVYHGPVLMASYYLPELEVRRPTVFSALRRGVLLALGAPFFTLAFLFVIIAVTILAVISRFGMAVFVIYPGIVAVLLTHATRALFIRFGVIEERPDIVEDKGWKL